MFDVNVKTFKCLLSKGIVRGAVTFRALRKPEGGYGGTIRGIKSRLELMIDDLKKLSEGQGGRSFSHPELMYGNPTTDVYVHIRFSAIQWT
jgi:hypothetical protein